MFFDDFLTFITSATDGLYVKTTATDGTMVLTDAIGGQILATCTANNGRGTQIQMGGGTVGEAFIPSAASTIYFECRLKITATATPPEFFIGLSEQDTTIIATDVNSSANHIGFETVLDNGTAFNFHSEKASTRGSVSSVLAYPSTWCKLGFKAIGLSKVEIWVNGSLYSTMTTGATTTPIVEMKPSFVFQGNGTTTPTCLLDWWCFAQVEDIDNN